MSPTCVVATISAIGWRMVYIVGPSPRLSLLDLDTFRATKENRHKTKYLTTVTCTVVLICMTYNGSVNIAAINSNNTATTMTIST